MGVIIIPDLTLTRAGVPSPPTTAITEQGTGPAQNVWPPNEASASPATVNPVSWTLAAWYVDPQNVSGNASDNNKGDDPSFPVQSYNGGIVAKWGTTSPILRQDTTLTWMSSQPVGGSDPVIFNPICAMKTGDTDGAVATIQGVPTLVHSGVLANVVAKNRATAQMLTAALGDTTLSIGTLVKNTTAGKVSWSFIHLKGGGGLSYTFTQPLVPQALPQPEPHPSSALEVDTWANGDTYEAYSLPHVNLVQSEPIAAAFNTTLSYPAPVQLAEIAVYSGDEVNSNATTTLDNVSMLNCYIDTTITGAFTTGGDLITAYFGSFIAGSAVTRNEQVNFIGGAIYSPLVGSSVGWGLFDYDVIIDCNETDLSIGSPSFGQGLDVVALGLVCINGHAPFALEIATGDGNAHSSLSAQNIIWGTGAVDIALTSRLVYGSGVGAATATFLMLGGLTINAQTTASNYNSVTGVWTANITLTPAHLDAGGFFGGFATRPGGGTITNQVAV